MGYTFYEIAMLCFTYSFLAWMAETAVATFKIKAFRNRGFASGPFCFIYGFTGVLLTLTLQDLKQNTLFLFLGSALIATGVEWFTGKLLERMKQKKWWDYSDKKWNFDGYICLQYSLLWGLLGFLVVRYGNGFVLGFYHILPDVLGKVLIWVLAVVAAVDICGSIMTVCHIEEKLPGALRFAAGVLDHIGRRMVKAYPATGQARPEFTGQSSEKCGIVQLFWLFVIGAFLGDVVETIFCRITLGEWMSRSSLVWGPFSVVWGLGIALVTALLYRDRDKQEHHIFWVGTFLGGAYEYICSVFTEIAFGKVFWDYSSMPFNLGGRINLLYCFFWGIAAVVWIKTLYPKVSRLIDWILKRTGLLLTACLALFMAVNIGVSVLALVRYDTRACGGTAVHKWEQVMDRYYDDDRMMRIYPKAKQQE